MSFLPLLAGVLAFAASVAGVCIQIIIRRRVVAAVMTFAAMAILVAGSWAIVTFAPLTPSQHSAAFADACRGLLFGAAVCLIAVIVGRRP